MKNIDFIKWMCEKADGFEEIYLSHGTFVKRGEYSFNIENNSFKDIIYPLLLQRAIEGVNREDNVFRVEQMYDCIDILDAEEYTTIIRHDLEDYINNDSAKESALRYIYEQESDKLKYSATTAVKTE